MVTVLGLACLTVAAAPDTAPRETKAPAATKGKPGTDRYGDPLPDGALARLGTTRLRHGADVTFVAFGPDGRTLVTAAEDNTIRIWDLAGGREIRRFARPRPAAPEKAGKGRDGANKDVDVNMVLEMMAGGNNGSSFNVALAPDKKTLAASGSGNVIQLWDVETGKALRQIKGPPGRLAGLLFSPDGRTLAGRTANGSLLLWAADTGKELHRIQPPPRKQGNAIVLNFGGNPGVAPGMAFSPDGKLIAAAVTVPDQDPPVSAVKFWDIASGKEIRQIKAPAGVRVSAVAFTPDGKLLAFSAGDAIHLYESGTGKELRRLKTPDGGVLIFSPDGKTLAALARNQRLRLWETATGKELHQLGDANPPRTTGGFAFLSSFTAPETRGLGFSPDGRQIAAASGSTVRIWETATGKEVPLLDGHRKALSAIAVSGNGKVVVSWGADRVIRRWDAATGRSRGTFPAPPRTTLAALSHDGRTIALANADNTIRLYDTDGKELHRMKGHASAALAFAPDGKVLASRGRADSTIRLYDVPRGAQLRQIAIQAVNNPAAGNVLVIGGSGGPPEAGPGLAFSPDGKLLVTPRPGRAPGATLAVLDVSTGRELRIIESPRALAGLTFSPDGRTLATENTDGTVTLWETASGKQRGQLGSPSAEKRQANNGMMGAVFVVSGLDVGGGSAPAGPVGLSFSPDGRALAVRGSGRSLRVWDVIAAKEVGRLKGHAGPIETVVFTPDGKSMATGAGDTTILLWDSAGPLKNLAQPAALDLSPAALESLWADLAGPDAGKAFQSTLKLAGAPALAVPFLGQRLKPAAVVDPRTIAGWITDLGSEKFAVRQKAAANLLETGPQTVPALRKSLASASLEARRRAEILLEQITGGTLTADELRLVRAIDALERTGTPPATRLLRTLASGATGTLTTWEAQAALDRLARSNTQIP